MSTGIQFQSVPAPPTLSSFQAQHAAMQQLQQQQQQLAAAHASQYQAAPQASMASGYQIQPSLSLAAATGYPPQQTGQPMIRTGQQWGRYVPAPTVARGS
eukprot:TRINITY_DN836_c0_g1_i4.p4 TRINITY_DN836_c0_g1~~TRINITY_DN836_c0_g1_i4.p4  ORF type:complete len:100 (+),score=36.50 TRINITY_DN836_c0_g1_i4:1431-1730(+)